MSKPILVVMAAGMGSRYGGLKQIDPISDSGAIIMDYSVFDAYKAEFSKVVFVIKEEMLADFKETIGARAEKYMKVEYAFQSLENLPEGLTAPSGRIKPLGTGHAVWCAGKFIDAPFAVINADDFYGRDSFTKISAFLQGLKDDDAGKYALVAYNIENTLTENGYVSRGVCTEENGNLLKVTERVQIEKKDGGIAFTEDKGATYEPLSVGTPVSMNMWGFGVDFIKELEIGLTKFFKDELPKNPEKAEYYLPFAVDNLITNGKATASVLRTNEKWYGVTYKEDKPMVVSAIAKLKQDGLYEF